MRRDPVPFHQVDIQDSFWKQRMDTLNRVTLPDCLNKCEQTGRIANFRRAAGWEEGSFQGIYFNDSDVYKVLEGVAYSLRTTPNPELEKWADEIIAAICAAQQPDGYLNTYYTLGEPGKRWTDMEKHEMYCAGHLIEAAIAYYQATGKDVLMKAALRLADHIDRTFGPGKRHWVPGHEEIELALMKLYRLTGEERYLRLARFLLEERGYGHGRGAIWDNPHMGAAYTQDDEPVAAQRRVKGHAVRAMYLYSAMADAMALGSEADYMPALLAIHEHVTRKNMYLTGGIGSSASNEGFTLDYDLPNDTAYCETCASVGMVYWNHRMNLLTGDGQYADILERSMYNGALAGYALSGDQYLYANPLASAGDKHRSPWFGCSCCPTQLARFIPSIGGYVYAAQEDRILVNLYICSRTTITLASGTVVLRQETDFPWDGRVRIRVEQAQSPFTLSLRLPGWCHSFTLIKNGRAIPTKRSLGYLDLGSMAAGDEVVFTLDMAVRRIHARPEVFADAGLVAFERGPLVYCAEETDQTIPWEEIHLDPLAPVHRAEGPFGAQALLVPDALNRQVTLIPYCLWDNREPGCMAVWLPEAPVPEQLYY